MFCVVFLWGWEGEKNFFSKLGDLIEVLVGQALVREENLIEKGNVGSLFNIDLEGIGVQKIDKGMEMVLIDELVLEDADFGDLEMRVLMEVLKEGSVDLSVGE